MDNKAETYQIPLPAINSDIENDSTKVTMISEELTIKGTYVWRIQNFNPTKLKRVGIIESETFHTGSSDQLRWRMSIEDMSDNGMGLMCIRVKLENDRNMVKAKYEFHLLDRNHAKTEPGAMATIFNTNKGNSALTVLSTNFLTKTWSDFLLSDGHLNILCEITAQLEPRKSGIVRDLGHLLESGRLSDVKLVVDKVEFPAHRSILGSRSPVFAAMFENDMIENKESVVEISDIEPEVLKELLRFIYTERVKNLDELSLELLAAADKYALDDLKFKCEDVLCDSIDIENVVLFLVHADLHGSQKLKSRARDFIVKNAEKVVKTEGYKAVGAAHLHLLTEILPISE